MRICEWSEKVLANAYVSPEAMTFGLGPEPATNFTMGPETLASVAFLTRFFRHKYPARYMTYLITVPLVDKAA